MVEACLNGGRAAVAEPRTDTDLIKRSEVQRGEGCQSSGWFRLAWIHEEADLVIPRTRVDVDNKVFAIRGWHGGGRSLRTQSDGVEEAVLSANQEAVVESVEVRARKACASVEVLQGYS